MHASLASGAMMASVLPLRLQPTLASAAKITKTAAQEPSALMDNAKYSISIPNLNPVDPKRLLAMPEPGVLTTIVSHSYSEHTLNPATRKLPALLARPATTDNVNKSPSLPIFTSAVNLPRAVPLASSVFLDLASSSHSQKRNTKLKLVANLMDLVTLASSAGRVSAYLSAFRLMALTVVRALRDVARMRFVSLASAPRTSSERPAHP
jgi:hypothetical protein